MCYNSYMPELPEVTTTVNGINKYAKGYQILDVWIDLKSKDKRFSDTIKNQKYFHKFKSLVIGTKILKAERRAKNILIHLSNGQTILIHMKMTGHIMFGQYAYNKRENKWLVHEKEKNTALRDPYNRFIHAVFVLNKNKHLVYADTRKFGTIRIFETKEIFNSKHLRDLGPEPLDKNFNLEKFIEAISKKQNGQIKTVLLDQTVVSGIGNIYSDEALFLSKINPKRKVVDISKKEFSLLFKSILVVLKKGIDFGGDSTSDYRNILGERGEFQHIHNVYRRKGEKCKKKGCSGVIIRSIVGARSAHYCSIHQK